MYKEIVQSSWKFLLENHISSLPVSVTNIAKNMNIALVKDSRVHEIPKGYSGMTICKNGRWLIIYNDKEPLERCRFTILHEIWHIIHGDITPNKPRYRHNYTVQDTQERAAEMFAIRVLAPACVLHELRIFDPEGISKLCGISLQAAIYRARRMTELEHRNKYYTDPLEKQLLQQFIPFIEERKK